jgi:CYTH domain-containing protein/8-oxo-dGTP pyrophosphatase MutT (NUDIX family)
MGNEIERKFYGDAGRLGKPLSTIKLEQGYLPETGSTEVRLRRAGTELFLTLKAGGGAQRYEWEVPLSPADFDALWSRTVTRVSKVRQRFAWKGHTLEIDRYEGALDGLSTAEVEFSSLAEAKSFAVPKSFGPELTWDPRFKNRALAEDGTVPRAVGKGIWSYGVLPYRVSPRGIEIIAVTTRRHDRWIVPKGQPEPGRTAQQVALDEAREEAGITGRITGHPLVLPYPRETGTTNLLLFPLLVTKLADRWLESEQRERRAVTVAEAGAYGDVIRLGAQAISEIMGTVGS